MALPVGLNFVHVEALQEKKLITIFNSNLYLTFRCIIDLMYGCTLLHVNKRLAK